MSLAERHLNAHVDRPWWFGPRVAAAALAVAMTVGIVATFAAHVTVWSPAAIMALSLISIAAVWISGGAATALLGLFVPTPEPVPVPSAWRPSSRTAILVTLCGESADPVAAYLAALTGGLERADLSDWTEVFVLSDTTGAERIAAEERAMVPLRDAGVLSFRRRERNTGRKPGNIADWVDEHGARFDHMVVLDADSRMTPGRIRRMIWQMERQPRLGLLQAGIALLPGQTRFGRHQRVAARLLSRGFGRGFAAWSGESGNYWGHNAIIRVEAFAKAARLPVLRGPAPWGGMLLSHDFVEAAWIRRAGWAVSLDPDAAGSAEEAPQTLEAFHGRNRRWCQGNLQHLRLIAEPGLDPVSRLHLAMGVLSYLVAPVWLILVVLVAFGGVPVAGVLPIAVVAGVLLLPKLCALAEWWKVARTRKRRAKVLRAVIGELAASSLIAPLIMLRQVFAVLAVCAGRDCGWKTGGAAALRLSPGHAEALVGLALSVSAVAVNGVAAAWLLPVALPLLCAPLVMGVLDRTA